MSTDTLSLSLSDLTAARTVLLARAETLKVELSEVESELGNLNVLIQAFERYAGANLGLATQDSSAHVPVPGVSGVSRDASQVIRRKSRIPSTEMVGELVRKLEVQVTREEIRERFRETYGYPPSWTNPVNALNNAISRAVDRGLITELEDGTYVVPRESRGW